MIRKIAHIFVIIILLFNSLQNSYAQNNTNKNKTTKDWSLGLDGGVNLFWGDIKFNKLMPSTKMHELQGGFGVNFTRKINSRLRLAALFNGISLKGQKLEQSDTLSFHTQALSFGIQAQLDLLQLLSKKERNFAFYITSGAGMLYWQNLLQNISTQDTLANLGWTNKNKEFAAYIPLGLRLEYQINPKLSIGFASTYRLAFSDLLDGQITAAYDSYSFSSLGISYHFGKQKIVPKLLPYTYFELAKDSTKKITPSKKKKVDKKEVISNPFSIQFECPETAAKNGFKVDLKIAKIGIPANGYFRLELPSGFIPSAATSGDVSFTKLEYNYEYDFIIPMNQDSSTISIPVALSEIGLGDYPILLKGEIMDQKGNVFPLKFATYIKIITENEWYQGLPSKEKQAYQEQKLEKSGVSSAKKQKPLNSTETNEKESIQKSPIEKAAKKPTISQKSYYSVQILASKHRLKNLADFKKQHHIQDEVFIMESPDWIRYSLYKTPSHEEAIRLCQKVKTEYNIPQAFIRYVEDGKIQNTSKTAKRTTKTKKLVPGKTISEHSKEKTLPSRVQQYPLENVYRIEIASEYDQKIPAAYFKGKIDHERISEFKQDLTYYYTVGEFKNLDVARAFLDYVKTQYKREDAKIVIYKGSKRIKALH